MPLPTLNYYCGVKLTLRLLTAGGTTKTVWFTDRVNFQTNADAIRYWPLLRELSDFGCEMDEYVPKPFTGSFTIDNSIGTFEEGRKFSDVLDRYTAIDQQVQIYMDSVGFESQNVNFQAGDLQWVGKVVSISQSMDNDTSTLTFSIQQDPIPDSKLSAMVTEATIVRTTATQGQGKWLPIAAGNANFLPAYKIGAWLGGQMFAYATNYGVTFQHKATGIYSRDIDGNWCPNTIPLTSTYARTTEATSFSLDPSVCAERVFAISNPSNYSGIMCSVAFAMKAHASAITSTCMLRVTVYERNGLAGTLTDRTVASGTYNLVTNDGSNKAGVDFTIEIPLDRATTLNGSLHGYAVGVSCTNWQATDAEIYKSDAGTCDVWIKNANGQYAQQSAQKAPGMTCYFAYLVDGDGGGEDNEGKAAAVFRVNGHLATIDSFQNVELIVSTAGIQDDSSGTITGTPNQSITRPDDFIKLATCTSTDGVVWNASADWDWTQYASDLTAIFGVNAPYNFARHLLGYQDAPLTFRNLLEGVCKDMACRVGMTNAGQLFIWPWGRTQAIAAAIPPEDIIPMGWDVGDTSSIVNRIKLNYGVTNVDIAAWKNKTQKNNYTGSLDRASAFNGPAQALVAQSRSCFANRELDITDSDYIGDVASAKAILDFNMIRYAYPITVAQIQVPFHKYYARRVLEVVTFAHPAFPNYTGACGHQEEVPEDGASAERAYLKGNRHWTTAKYWRGQIEKRTVIKPLSGAPRIALALRVLPNYPVDPT